MALESSTARAMGVITYTYYTVVIPCLFVSSATEWDPSPHPHGAPHRQSVKPWATAWQSVRGSLESSLFGHGREGYKKVASSATAEEAIFYFQKNKIVASSATAEEAIKKVASSAVAEEAIF